VSGVLHWSYRPDVARFFVWDEGHSIEIHADRLREMWERMGTCEKCGSLNHQTESHKFIDEDLPSAADLDSVAEEQRITEATSNIFALGPMTMEALGDRVLVLVDEFRSGYECTACGGRQKVRCTDCVNGHSTLNPNMQCKTCHGSMEMVCAECEGRGVEKGGLVIQDNAQNRPESGVIVSVGEHVGMGTHRLFGAVRIETREPQQKLRIGDKILFGRFSGHQINMATSTKEEVVFRILNESEVLTRITGHLELRRLRKESREQVL
jgi:co-chaperonin GroES (HSP10)